jgi:hypothetical protein
MRYERLMMVPASANHLDRDGGISTGNASATRRRRDFAAWPGKSRPETAPSSVKLSKPGNLWVLATELAPFRAQPQIEIAKTCSTS